MRRNWPVNHIYKIIFTTLLILTCASYIVAIKISTDIGREQAKTTHAKLLNLYMEKLDATFSNANNYLINYISTSDHVLEQVRPEDSLSYELAKIAIHQDLVNGVLLHSDIDAFFYCNLSDDVYIQSRSSQIPDFNLYLKEEIFGQIQSGEEMTSTWRLIEMRGDYYMIRMEQYRTAYVGAWISLESIVESLKETYQKEGGDAVIFDKDGNMLTDTRLKLEKTQMLGREKVKAEDGKAFLQICRESQRTPLVIAAYISDNVIVEEIRQTSMVLTTLMLVIILLIIFAMLVMKRTMVDEVSRLQIEIYKKQIEYQNMWLQYLQVQVQPHFFLNTLNLIYSMSRLNQNEMIQKLSLYLVEYFRYLFREPMSYVTLETELRHVKNYLEIQKMRFPGKFEYEIRIQESEKCGIIPPLIIQTFAENCIKHAGYSNKLGNIRIIVERRETNVEITIADNGQGFSVEMLKLLNDERKTISKDKIYHIGIDNARLRLKLFFDNNYFTMFYNSQGAVVKLIIPYMEEKNNVQRDFD